jgi:aspartate kinase
LIVMKFGGSSIADAEKIRAVTEIVRGRLERRPVVVLSALGGVTDLLESAIAAARTGDLDALEAVLAELERCHRWALAGAVEDPGRRHDLGLSVDGLFESLRGKLRSIRILGEGTPRTIDAVLSIGEMLSTRIVVAAFRERGLPAVWIDPLRLMATDDHFGCAAPDVDRVRVACAERLRPQVDRGELPVVAGFVGSSPGGETTTLGRGGSDTSAAVLGLAATAEEIEIWTDVDGMMSADPRLVPEARTLARVSFAEAAELACYGARVLHPASIAPAVRKKIPVRILNSLRPEGAGTLVFDGDSASTTEPVAVTSRGGVDLVRISSHKMSMTPDLLRVALDGCRRLSVAPDPVLTAGASVTMVVPCDAGIDRLTDSLPDDVNMELLPGRAIVGVVGSALTCGGPLRGHVLSELARWAPDLITQGASRTSVLAVLPESELEAVVHRLHRRFFEEGATG